MPQAIVIDCDPGQDDALALLLAFASPELEVIAVTAVAGNVPLALTEKNARKLVELVGRPDVPVYAGCADPMARDLVTAEHVHGRTGLDGADLPDPTVPLAAGDAVDALIGIIRERPEKTVTLCPTGPLTNVATAFQKAPDIVARVGQIVLMGGALGEGNVTPSAEFNIYVDPDAAKIVFESGLPIVMCGLDVTHQALVTPARLDALRRLETPVGRAVTGMLEFYNVYDQTRRGRVGAPLHDPCVIAYLLRPDLFAGRDCAVDIETTGAFTLGRTVVDWSGRTGRPANVKVITEIDSDGFFSLLTERLAKLPDRSQPAQPA